MKIGDRIKQERTARKWSQEALANRCGWDRQARISNYENGVREPDLADLGLIAKAFGMTLSELMDGGTAIREPARPYGNITEVAVPSGGVPLISWVQAGAFCDPEDPYQPGDAEEWLPCPTVHSAETFALRVQGDSMTSQHPGQRSYPEGAIIFVDPARQPANGSRVIAKVDGQVTFKVLQQDMGRVFLRPINQAYPTVEVSAEDLHVCGVVIGAYLPE